MSNNFTQEDAYKTNVLQKDGRYICWRQHRFNEPFYRTSHGCLTIPTCPLCGTNQYAEFGDKIYEYISHY